MKERAEESKDKKDETKTFGLFEQCGCWVQSKSDCSSSEEEERKKNVKGRERILVMTTQETLKLHHKTNKKETI